ncbi:MAG: hypothetical protein WB586_08185 [Chthoniobacterales bacterium]
MSTIIGFIILVILIGGLAQAQDKRRRLWRAAAALQAEQEWREKTIAAGILRADVARAEANLVLAQAEQQSQLVAVRSRPQQPNWPTATQAEMRDQMAGSLAEAKEVQFRPVAALRCAESTRYHAWSV